MNSSSINILIAGTGGQGVLLTGDIIAGALVNEGYDVKASALRGIAQRGGIIFSHVRASNKVYSPLIPKGGVDILITLELLECASQIEYLNKNGQLFFLDKYIPKSLVKARIANGTRVIVRSIKESFGVRAMQIPYDEAVKNLKDVKMANMFILGVVSNYLSINNRSWLKAIVAVFPRNIRYANLSAFSFGINYRDKVS